MAVTLAQAVVEDRVEFEELHRRYNPVLNLVNVLIGVVPYCDRYLEIWPPGFRTYNMFVPNFLNLPSSLFGFGAPKDMVGLAMYASSRAAACAYCSAHTCSYALRRGSSTEAVTGESRTDAEQAVVAVAEALSTDPHHYTPETGAELRKHYSASDAEWIVMGVAVMGFLNKFMDAVGVELEPEAINDVSELIGPTGWTVGQHAWADPEGTADTAEDTADAAEGTVDAADGPSTTPPKDSFRTMMRVLRHGPGASRLEKRWTAGIPKNAAAAKKMIADEYGYDDGLMFHMAHAKPRRAIATVLRDNLDPEQSELGIGLKALVGLVFAVYMDNPYLVERAMALARHHDVDEATITAARGFFPGSAAAEGLDERTIAALSIARVMSPSPAIVDAESIELAEGALSSAEIIETAVWISVSQLLHRLTVYFEIDAGPRDATDD